MEPLKRIINTTSDLIKFQTTKDNPKELKRCVEFVAKQFPKNIHVTKGINKNKPYVIISVNKTKTPKLLLTGHLDVIEAEQDQYEPKIRGGRIYGRGSADMKAGAAIGMQVLKEETEKDIALMLTTDEEIGGADGIGFLSTQGWKPKIVLSVEPSEQKINIKEKGVLWLKIKTTGKAAHGSTPWKGENAIDKVIKKYFEIKKMFPKPNPKKWRVTMNLGLIKGGQAYNKVPDWAEIGIDIRYTEKDDVEEILRKIKKVKDIKIEIAQKQPMLDTDEKDIYMKRLRKIGKTRFRKETGASDIRFFAKKGVPAADFGPVGANYHGKNEWVSIKSMGSVYQILKEFIKGL
ncbi:M20 family metallopeptidase [Candidatus Woesearchaeota archaeon]|nr:M20 family metallopeptidase [Candidatus Woesearchaeota archaeon]